MPPRHTLLSLILYLLCALIALTLLIILLMIMIYTYRKQCCPTRRSTGTRVHRQQRVGIQVEKRSTTVTNDHPIDVRPCF